MSIEAWKKKVNLWTESYQHIPEVMRLSLIMGSLKNNKDRSELENSSTNSTKINVLTPASADLSKYSFRESKKKFQDGQSA